MISDIQQNAELKSREDLLPFFENLSDYSTKTSSAKLVPVPFFLTGFSVDRGVPAAVLMSSLESMIRTSQMAERGFGKASSEVALTFPVDKECKLYEALVWGQSFGVASSSLGSLVEQLETSIVSKGFSLSPVDSYNAFSEGAVEIENGMRTGLITGLLEKSDLEEVKSQLITILSAEGVDAALITQINEAKSKEVLKEIMLQQVEANSVTMTQKAFSAKKDNVHIAGLWTGGLEGDTSDEPMLIWCVLGDKSR